MKIRCYQKKDYSDIANMMRIENNKIDGINSNNTIVMEDNGIIGFFTWVIEHNLPVLKYFCFKRDKRNLNKIRLMLKVCKTIIKNLGYSKMIININQQYLCKLAEYYFKAKLYNRNETNYFYIVEV